MHKLGGQILVGLLLAWEPGALIGDVEVLEAVGLGFLAVVSMNAINTWDHADGLTGGLSAVALASGAPGLAAAVAGYLPFNTFLRQPAGAAWGRSTTGAPRAMLGDSGAHLLGVALVAVPGAAWFLVVPLLDLARVAIARIRRGQPFWVGDRTHLGHRLEGLGLHPVMGALVAVLAASAPLGAVPFQTEPGSLGLWLLATGGLYSGLVVLTGEKRRQRARA